MVIIFFLISAAILFTAFVLLQSMPKLPQQHASDYNGYYMEIAERIASIKEVKHIETALHVKLQFENKYKFHPMVKKDSEILQLQIEGKKRKLGGLWL